MAILVQYHHIIWDIRLDDSLKRCLKLRIITRLSVAWCYQHCYFSSLALMLNCKKCVLSKKLTFRQLIVNTCLVSTNLILFLFFCCWFFCIYISKGLSPDVAMGISGVTRTVVNVSSNYTSFRKAKSMMIICHIYLIVYSTALSTPLIRIFLQYFLLYIIMYSSM